jgi:hypothetical protein
VGAVFERKQIDLARYGRELVPYTWGPATLPAGQTPIFDVSDWNPGDSTDKVVVLTSLAATQNAGVQLLWSYDGQQSDQAQGWTDAMPAGLRPMRINAWAARRLALTVNNATGAPIANFQLNYTVLVWRLPTSWEKMLGYQPSDEDLQLLSSLPNQDGTPAPAALDQLLRKGTQPIAWERTWDALFANRRLPDFPAAVPRHVTTSSATQQVYLPSLRVPAGTVAILRGIGVEGQPAGVVVMIDRDNDAGYVQVNAAAIARADDEPLEAFVPATDHLALSVSGAVGTFAVRPIVELYKLSDLMAIHLGIQTTPQVSYAKVRSGLQ